MKKLLIVFIVLTAFGVSVAAENKCDDHLFYISKSDNKNIIYYDAELTKDGTFDTKNPIDIYWIMYAEDGQKEGMTMLEKPHFGIDWKAIKKGTHYQFVIKALEDKNIDVSFIDGCPKAVATISGVQSYVKNVFVQIDPKSGFIPKVLDLDLNGISTDNATPTTERVTPK